MPKPGSRQRLIKPARPPHRLLQALLVVMVVAVGFVTLMVRLAVMREGYRLSALRSEQVAIQERNRNLRLRLAQLTAPERLRALAIKYRLVPPAPGQVVVVP
ncbi:MAG TPA: hypothetical protein VKV28_11115 [Candidatus Binataceae bacterium]|nr:hypothetical protein [Candidatus Binataceae bacterium]